MPPKKKNKDDVVGTDEVATDYKLQKFLEDVQKFTERSKKIDEKHKRSRKGVDDSKEACQKRGLFENGFKSKPFLKENKARLKSNLNDLVKECTKSVADEEENLLSDSSSSLEESHDVKNQDVSNNNNSNASPSRDERVADQSERSQAPEAEHKASNSPRTIIKDRDQLKALLWEKYCERVKCTESVAKLFPYEDHMKVARQRINQMIYRTFLLHARKYPTILRRIFSTNEIKRLAQVVVKETADKCEQTEDMIDTVSNNVQCKISTKEDSILSFPHSSQNSCDSQKEGDNFFDLNIPKKTDTRVNFLDSLENQADIYSPGVQNTSPDCNVTPPPSPLPVNIRECWAPSTVSTPRKPDIFSPSVSHILPSFQKPSISPPEPLTIDEPNLARNRRKKTSQLQFMQNMENVESPQLCFPKRKRLAYSPHRL